MLRGLVLGLLISSSALAGEPVIVGQDWSREFIEKTYFKISPYSGLMNFVSEESPLNVVSRGIYKIKDHVDPRRIQVAVQRCSTFDSPWKKLVCASQETLDIARDKDGENLCRYLANTISRIADRLNFENLFLAKKSFFEDGGRGHIVTNLIVRDIEGYTYGYIFDVDLDTTDGKITLHPNTEMAKRLHNRNGQVLPRLL